MLVLRRWARGCPCCVLAPAAIAATWAVLLHVSAPTLTPRGCTWGSSSSWERLVAFWIPTAWRGGDAALKNAATWG